MTLAEKPDFHTLVAADDSVTTNAKGNPGRSKKRVRPFDLTAAHFFLCSVVTFAILTGVFILAADYTANPNPHEISTLVSRSDTFRRELQNEKW